MQRELLARTVFIFLFALALLPLGATAQSAQLAEAKQKVADAQNALTEANKNLLNVKDKLKADFLSSEEVSPLVDELAKAQEAFEAAKAPVIEKARAGADYQAALKAKTDASEQLQSMRAAKSASPEQFADVNKQMTQAQSKMDALEADAIKSDPAVSQAKTVQESAKKALDAKLAEFNSTLNGNSELEEAKAAIETAKQDLADAKKQFAEVQKQEQANRKNSSGGRSNKGGGSGPQGGGGARY